LKECDNVPLVLAKCAEVLDLLNVCHLFNQNPVSRSQLVGLELLKAGGLNVRVRTSTWRIYRGHILKCPVLSILAIVRKVLRRPCMLIYPVIFTFLSEIFFSRMMLS
jgi:hypothetical protein